MPNRRRLIKMEERCKKGVVFEVSFSLGGNHPGPTPGFFLHGSKPYKWKPGSHTMDFVHIQTHFIALIQFYRLHTALLLIVECTLSITCRAIRVVVVCYSAYSNIV
jgi:hypothetical protein